MLNLAGMMLVKQMNPLCNFIGFPGAFPSAISGRSQMAHKCFLWLEFSMFCIHENDDCNLAFKLWLFEELCCPLSFMMCVTGVQSNSDGDWCHIMCLTVLCLKQQV